MTVYVGPKFGNTDFDASRWRDLYSNLFGTGIIAGARVQGASGGDLAASATSGLGWSVATGAALIKGFAAIVDTAAATGTLSAADPSLPRIDTIVLSWTYNSGVPTLSVTQVTGTPASSPVPPTLTQNDTTFQFPLANCRVNAGATTIASVTDMRTYCAAVNSAALSGATFTGGVTAPSITATGVGGVIASAANAAVELGAKASSNTPFIDFNSSGFSNDYDVRVIASGGSVGGNAAGTLNVQASALQQNGIPVALTGSHNTIVPLKISAGTTLPGTLDSREIFILLA